MGFRLFIYISYSDANTAESHRLPFLHGTFLHCIRFCSFAWFAFGFDYLDDFWRTDQSRFSLCGLGWFWVLNRRRLFPWAALKNMDVFDPLTSKFWWVATGGSDLQIHLLDPPGGRRNNTRVKKNKYQQCNDGDQFKTFYDE